MKTDAPIHIRMLQQDSLREPGSLRTIELRMSAHDRRRVRRLVEAPDGAVFALELPTGTILHPGQLLYQDQDHAYVVTAADEDVLVIRPRDIAEAAAIAHLIGNLHRDIEVSDAEIITLADETLADRLEKTGTTVNRLRRPFHGRAPGEHAH
jgi:urease accessory protein